MDTQDTETNVVGEQTPQVEDTSTETIQSEVSENSTLPSGEDNNAQVGDTQSNYTEDTVAAPEFDSLMSQRQTLWEKELSEATQVEAQMQNRGLSPSEQLKEFGMTAGELKANRLEQQILWDKAMAKHPELAKDKELTDVVYSTYAAKLALGEQTTPLEVTDQLMGYLSKREASLRDSTYKQAENDISAKTLASTKTPKRSGAMSGDSVSDLKQKAAEGDERALNDLLAKF